MKKYIIGCKDIRDVIMNNSSNTEALVHFCHSPSSHTEGLNAFAIVMLVFILLNIIFHSIGCFLLVRLYKNGRQNVQQIYLINLSITHALGNVFQLVSRVLLIVSFPVISEKPVCDFQYFLINAMFTLFTFSYYMSMIYLTIDKALDILLNIKYPLYWNEKKAKHLVYATWVFGVILCLSVFFLYTFLELSFESVADVFFLYFYPTFDFSFILLAVVCYSFLFHKYKEARMAPAKIRCGNDVEKCGSLFAIFRTSRFYISVLLICTFLLFMVLPNMVYLFYGVIGRQKSTTLDDILLIFFNGSYLLDAWIYIFAQRPVLNLLCRKVQRRRYTSERFTCACLRTMKNKLDAGRNRMGESIPLDEVKGTQIHNHVGQKK